jgi:hypothetical protein
VGTNDNIKTVQAMYEAFSRGDIGAIQDNVTDDVDWATDTNSTGAPWYGVRHGKDGVATFFEAFGSSMEVDEFMPLSIAASDDAVLSVVRFRARGRSTGKAIDANLHHYFKFRGNKVYYYRGTEDTSQVEAALRG